jgi:tryptophan 2,3-dioxygenase
MKPDAEDYSQPILAGDGASDCERYLRTDELLALRKTPDEQVHRDELLFQTVHQASELWLQAPRDAGGAARQPDQAARLPQALAGAEPAH